MPAVEAVSKQVNQERVTMLTINIKEQKEVIAKAVGDFGLTLPVLLDSDGAVAESYNVQRLPTSFFIDKEGKISDIAPGIISQGDLQTKLNALGSR